MEYEAPVLCPVCTPDADPLYASVRLCHEHDNLFTTDDDNRIRSRNPYGTISGTGDVDSETNRAACNFIHRGITRTEPVPASPEWKNWDPIHL